jgi:hypothetical protein
MSYRDIIINLDYIMQFDPCESGVKGYVNAGYKDFSGDIFEFLSLEKISVKNRLWVVLRPEIIPENDLHELACRFAESVLHIFEKKYPNDDRPRKAIETKRKFVKGEIDREELNAAWDAASAAARDAASAAARDAARDAAWDAASAAARDAASAAARDAARDAAWDAAWAAAWAAGAAAWAAGAAEGDAEEKKQIKIVLEYLEEKNELQG